MPKQNRGDLARGLDQLFKTAVDQLDELKDVIVSSSSAGKAKLDATMLKRERDRVLQKLGEAVAGTDDQAGFPVAWQELIAEARGIEDQIAAQEREYERLVKAAVDGLGQAAAGVGAKASRPAANEEDGDESASASPQEAPRAKKGEEGDRES